MKKKSLEETVNLLGTRFDIMGNLIPLMIEKKMRIKAYIYSGEWYDIGSLERYEKLDHEKIDQILGFKKRSSK